MGAALMVLEAYCKLRAAGSAGALKNGEGARWIWAECLWEGGTPVLGFLAGAQGEGEGKVERARIKGIRYAVATCVQ